MDFISVLVTKSNLNIICLIMFLNFCSFHTLTTEELHEIPVGSDSSLSWVVDGRTKTVKMEIRTNVKRGGWFALGFSNYGELTSADYCVFWVAANEKATLTDTWMNENGKMTIDEKQDCRNFQYKNIRNGDTIFSYTRKIDTSDSHDYKIEEGTTHIVYIRGDTCLETPKDITIQSATESGFEVTTLLYNPTPPSLHPPDTFVLDVRADSNLNPSHGSVYWCSIFKLPTIFEVKHHLIQFEKIMEPEGRSLVHHMHIFHCKTNPDEVIPHYNGDCHAAERPKATFACKRVIAAWALGATASYYPAEAGVPIGGPDSNPYIMMELHYHLGHHRKRDAIITDQSGFRLYLTKTLRKYDAGIMELGLEYNDKMAIPPGEERFNHTGFCVTECTAKGLPSRGIVVFASQLHTHELGRRVYTKHIRNGRELPELNRDNHYNSHFQEIRRLKKLVKVLPGDDLVTTCEYNSKNRTSVTLTGFDTNEEMCVNYIHYYPATDLEVCKSSIPDAELATFFKKLRKEGQATSRHYGISNNYKVIEWTPKVVEELQQFYLSSPLSVQCDNSMGESFPGKWEGLPNTKIIQAQNKPGRA